MREAFTRRTSLISRKTRMARKPLKREMAPLEGAKMSKKATPIETTSIGNHADVR